MARSVDQARRREWNFLTLNINATTTSVENVPRRRVRETEASWSIDRHAAEPLHEQIASLIRRAIADGEKVAGERIPQAKDLAAVLGVNTNTVLRAIRILREEGLLQFRRGRDIVVCGTLDQSAVVIKTRELVAFAQQRGYRREELVTLIENLG
jgi:GntR family transcriptional regulator